MAGQMQSLLMAQRQRIEDLREQMPREAKGAVRRRMSNAVCNLCGTPFCESKGEKLRKACYIRRPHPTGPFGALRFRWATNPRQESVARSASSLRVVNRDSHSDPHSAGHAKYGCARSWGQPAPPTAGPSSVFAPGGTGRIKSPRRYQTEPSNTPDASGSTTPPTSGRRGR